MGGYVTWNGLAIVIVAMLVANVLIHIGSDLVKLGWSRRKARKAS